MTSHDHRVPLTDRVPVVVRLPMLAVFAAIYPAIWNPAQQVRKVACTLMMISLVWLVLAAVATVHRWVADVTDRVVDHQVQQMRSTAVAQLDAAADTEWNQIVEQFTGPRMPEEPR